MRKFALILFLFAATLASLAGETNYLCVICGKGPLQGRIWMSKWGPVCDECYKVEDHCSICGLPTRDDFVKTADGRFICKFDRTNAVLAASEARQIFKQSRWELVRLFGKNFGLQYPEVTANLFDVDYWSEKGRDEGLHKFGFSSTRKAPSGKCTHLVVLLSGRLREEIAATSAHEYTHLWINENWPADHMPDSDTVEAICELSAYKLMEARSLPKMQQEILENPYTHGKIKTLVEIEKQHGMRYVLNWVKSGKGKSLGEENLARSVLKPSAQITNVPTRLPKTLKLNGLFYGEQGSRVFINNVAFETGSKQRVQLASRTLMVRCREILSDRVVLEIEDIPGQITLKMGEEKAVP